MRTRPPRAARHTSGGGDVKLHLPALGFLEYDEGWPLAGAGVSTRSDPAPASPRREVAMIAALIEHPKAGPILFDTGAATGFRDLCPPIVQELFAILRARASARRGARGRGLRHRGRA